MSSSNRSGSSVRGWLSQLVGDLKTHRRPWWPLARSGYYGYLGLWHTVTSRWPLGTNVYERDWDVLVILDACRFDAMAEVADEYAFLDSVDSIWSVGSTSHEWVAKTFTEEWADEIADTAYVTGNGYINYTVTDGVYPPSGGIAPLCWPRWNVVDLEAFELVDTVWRDGRDYGIPTVPPHVMTDRAVATAREHDPRRLVVHYMQPHGPYMADAVEDRELLPTAADDVETFASVMETENRAAAWERYLDNLRFVLDEVECLLENVDANRVAISSDHGHLLGEFGISEHPGGCPLPAAKKVPWVETTATDERTLTPTVERVDTETSVENYLRDLGYAV